MSGIEWCAVAGGPFAMGSDPRAAYPPDPDETPRHVVDTGAFRLAREPVTNGEYATFVRSTGHPPPCSWPSGEPPVGSEAVPVTIALWATSNLFDVGHRIRVDISSSNWPRLDVNPNTGEPMGRHTHHVVAEQAVHVDADHPSHVVLPVIPA